MANEKFYLHFKSDNYGLKYIDEPVGYDSADFNLDQEDKRYARDISFSGGESEFRFYDLRKHEIEKLIYYHSFFGFEAKVSLGIEFEDTTDVVIGDLDFPNATTDGLTYFKCKVIQDSKQAILKKRKSINVNLLSDKDLDGNDIEPLVPENILLKAKPIVQISEWTVPNIADGGGAFSSTNDGVSNAINQVLRSEIEDTLSYIQDGTAAIDIRYLQAANNLKKVKVEVKNLTYESNCLSTELVYKVGDLSDFDSLVENTVVDDLPQFLSTPLNINFEIPIIKKGQFLWIYFRKTGPGFYYIFRTGSIKITATSLAYNTITPSFRLYDVLKYVTKSISGMDIIAPRFQPGGQFYDQRLFNGNFLRNIKDKGFFITLKDIEESLTELNADYEIQPDNVLFFGLYEDFYRSVEVGFFDATQFETLEKCFNPRYSINEFNLEYKNYQSQKENATDNTADLVHGKSQWLLSNIMVENKKDATIEWVRDSFLIEETRKKAIEDNDSIATQDDDKKFCIDTTPLLEVDRNFSEIAFLQHTYESTTEYNTLRNTGDFSFELLGISVGSAFTLFNTGNNGDHVVIEVTSRTVVLRRTSPGISNITGEFNTEFQYRIETGIADFVNWTDEGFTLINNINNGDNYANLRFSSKRNIVNFWDQYLATCNLYHKEKSIKNTLYKNNPDALTIYEGIQVKEGEDFVPENPILSPELFNNVTFICSFAFYKRLEYLIRTQRGFVRFINNLGWVIKGFPKNMSYSNLEKRLVCNLEIKYELSDMTITTDIPGMILINDETRVHSILYEVQNEKIIIFDENEEPLYNAVDWFRVSINGAIPSSLYELTTWFDLL